MTSALNDIMRRYYLNPNSTVQGGTTSTSSTSSSGSPSTLGLITGEFPMTLDTSLAGTPTMSLEILEGATISGGSIDNYVDLGGDTGGSLATINLSPTIDTRGTPVFKTLQANVLNLGTIVLLPNTAYVFEVTNTALTSESFRLSNIFRRI